MIRDGARVTIVRVSNGKPRFYKAYKMGKNAIRVVLRDELVYEEGDFQNLGFIHPNDEGSVWARGWYTPAARALRVKVGLTT
jgi:hypothetical protein